MPSPTSSPPLTPDRGRPGFAEAAGLAAILLGAALLTVLCGRRGFFAFDQSILFDAGQRVLHGQVPFRDFVLPFGPVAPWLQALGFRIFGADLAGYLATAAAADVAGAALAWWVVRTLVPGRPGPALLAGALTAIWLVPPSGTPWFDAFAYLLALVVVALLLAAGASGGGGRRAAAAVAAGAVAVAVALTKPNAVVPLAAVCLPLLAHPPGGRRRTAVGFAGGAALAAAAFALWLSGAAEPRLFLAHAVEIPWAEGHRRLAGRALLVAGRAVTGSGDRWIRAVLLGAMAVGGLRLARPDAGVRERRTALVLLGMGLGQNLFVATSNNQAAIAMGWTGVVLGLAFALLPRSGRWATATVALGALAIAGVAAGGLRIAWTRSVHDAPAAVELPAFAPVSGRWRTAGTPSAEDLRALLALLRRDGGTFFVFPDWTVLYGLTGRTAPQPLPWFHPGVTYDPETVAPLDRRIASAVAEVDRVVLERRSWLGTRRRLRDFPHLRRVLATCFAPERRFGLFVVLERTAACGETGPGARSAAEP